jgi:hypothetical protein
MSQTANVGQSRWYVAARLASHQAYEVAKQAIPLDVSEVTNLRRRQRNAVGCLLSICTLLCACPPDPVHTDLPKQVELDIPAIAQQTEVWCWAASAEMILLYYHEPNLNPAGDYQCGVVGAYFYLAYGPSHPCVNNCYLCQTGASSTGEIQRILTGYGQLAQQYGHSARVLTSRSTYRPLTADELEIELSSGRPILAGISFPGQPTLPGISGHAVVLSGYDATQAAITVTVKDPYPYERFVPAYDNPYIAAGGIHVSPGTYRISLTALSSVLITWGNTIYAIQ